MKKLLLLFIVSIFMTFSLCIGVSIGAESFAHVNSVDGKVIVLRGDKSLDAVSEMILLKEDVIKTDSKASLSITFNDQQKEFVGIISASKEVKLYDFFLKAKIRSFKEKIESPVDGATKSTIKTMTIGATRGAETEGSEKKVKKLKNDHSWEEKVE